MAGTLGFVPPDEWEGSGFDVVGTWGGKGGRSLCAIALSSTWTGSSKPDQAVTYHIELVSMHDKLHVRFVRTHEVASKWGLIAHVVAPSQ
jgi:hypothetical protein